MARKKKDGEPGRAVAFRPNQGLALPADMQDEFAPYVSRDRASASVAGWPWISTQGSAAEMRLAGVESDELSVLILGANRANMYWPEYEQGVFTPPICYAVASLDWDASEVEQKLAPPPDLPGKQAESCSKCPMNAFGSARRGRGKACANTVRLALIPSDAEMIDKVEGAMLSVPPTSTRNYGSYVRPITDGLSRPIGTVITRIKKVPNKTGQGFLLTFATDGVINDRAKLQKILVRMKGDAKAALEQLPPSASDADAISTQGGPGRRRRKVGSRAEREAARSAKGRQSTRAAR